MENPMLKVDNALTVALDRSEGLQGEA